MIERALKPMIETLGKNYTAMTTNFENTIRETTRNTIVPFLLDHTVLGKFPPLAAYRKVHRSFIFTKIVSIGTLSMTCFYNFISHFHLLRNYIVNRLPEFYLAKGNNIYLTISKFITVAPETFWLIYKAFVFMLLCVFIYFTMKEFFRVLRFLRNVRKTFRTAHEVVQDEILCLENGAIAKMKEEEIISIAKKHGFSITLTPKDLENVDQKASNVKQNKTKK